MAQPVIPDFGEASDCVADNRLFCSDWVKENWDPVLQPALVQHIYLTAIAVGIGFVISLGAALLAHRLTHPSFEVPRTYRARVTNAPVKEPALRALREGVELEDGPTAPARVRRLGNDHIELTIHEGRKRQVRRMLEAVGHPVKALERVAFGPLRLGPLEPGDHRRLTAAELERLRALRPSPGFPDGTLRSLR